VGLSVCVCGACVVWCVRVCVCGMMCLFWGCDCVLRVCWVCGVFVACVCVVFKVW